MDKQSIRQYKKKVLFFNKWKCRGEGLSSVS